MYRNSSNEVSSNISNIVVIVSFPFVFHALHVHTTSNAPASDVVPVIQYTRCIKLSVEHLEQEGRSLPAIPDRVGTYVQDCLYDGDL